MDDIKTEQQFKTCLLKCVRYMTKVGESESVEVDFGKVKIELRLLKGEEWQKY